GHEVGRPETSPGSWMAEPPDETLDREDESPAAPGELRGLTRLEAIFIGDLHDETDRAGAQEHHHGTRERHAQTSSAHESPSLLLKQLYLLLFVCRDSPRRRGVDAQKRGPWLPGGRDRPLGRIPEAGVREWGG